MIGEIIRTERMRRHLSQQALAETLHCDRSLISLVETEKKRPTDEFLARVGTALHLDWARMEMESDTMAEISILRQARHLMRQGQWADGQLLAETAWWDLLQSGHSETADQAFEVWLDTLSKHPQSNQVLSMTLGYVVHKTVAHDWDRLFRTGVRLQAILLYMNAVMLAESVTQSLLLLSPPCDVACLLHIGLGTVFLRSDRMEDARYYYGKAQTEWSPSIGATSLGRCYHGIGAVAIILHQWDTAERATNLAVHLYQNHDEALYYAALQNLGFVYAQTRELSQAKDIFQQCLDYWVAHPDSDRLASLNAAMVESGMRTRG